MALQNFFFIDSRVENYQAFVAGLQATDTWVLLEADQEGLGQMVQALGGVKDLASIHIISHGAEESLTLGSTVLNLETLRNHQLQLAAIGASLNALGDIQIYGCNVAQGAKGEQFVQAIAQLTQADVAASKDLTGAAAAGGNWTLEYAVGQIDTSVLVNTNYSNTLEITTNAAGTTPSISIDTTVPTVTTFSPADEATAVAVGADIVLTFNEAIQRGAGSILLKTAAGTTVATYDAATSSNLSISGNTLTINPSLDLASMTGYSVVLASGTVKDLAGNLYAGTSDYNFTTSASPSMLSLGTVAGVDLNLIHSYTSANGKTYYLLDINGDGLSTSADFIGHDKTDLLFNGGGDTYDTQPNGAVAGVDDARTLLVGGYTLVLPTNAEIFALRTALNYTFPTGWQPLDYDSPNIPSASRVSNNVHYNVSFKSTNIYTNLYDGYGYNGSLFLQVLGEAADTTAPTVTTFSPADEATAVAVGADIVLTFNEAIKAGTGNLVLTNTANAGDTRTISVSDASQVSFADSKVTVNPTSNLLWDAHYALTMSAGVVQDLTGNAYTGISSATTLNFSTALNSYQGRLYVSGDDSYEVYVNGTFVGQDNGDGFPTAENWLLNLHEGKNVIAIIGRNNANGTHPGAVIAELAVGTQRIVSDASWSLSKTLSTGWNAEEFSTSNWSGALVYGDISSSVWWNRGPGDSSGVSIEQSGFPTDSSAQWIWSDGFTTDATVYFRKEFTLPSGAVAPTLAITSNVSAVTAGETATITFTFSEAPTGFDASDISVIGGTLGAISGTGLTRTATFTPTANTASGNASITVASGSYTDAAGYIGAAGTTPSISIDTTAPTVTTFSPADEATAVAVGADIVLTFNEAIQCGAGSILLKTAAGTTVATYDAATSSNLSISGKTLTINPSLDLMQGTVYKVEMSSGSIKDLAGNGFAGATDYNFMTAANGATVELHLRALIDGRDRLIVDDGKLRWEHFDNVVVGWWNGTAYVNEPTYVDVLVDGSTVASYSWVPTWPTLSPDPLRSYGLSSVLDLSEFGDFSKDATTTLTRTSARNSVNVVQLASSDNQWASITEFDDNPQGASAWYDVKLTFSKQVDYGAPTVTTFSPADEATAVDVGADIVLTFNEAIQRGTGSILLKTAAGTTVATYDAATSSNLSISGNTLTINPALDLATMTGYSVVLASGTVKDLAGNLYAGTSDYNFTTSASPSMLSLGTVAGVDLNLIHSYTSATGKTYYLLDINGDGESTSADFIGHDKTDLLFNGGEDTYDTQPNGAVAGVDDARTLLVGGYTLVLPTNDEIFALRTALNYTFPTGWQPLDYDSPNIASASRVSNNVHYNVSFKSTNIYTNLYDGYGYNGSLFLQVLGEAADTTAPTVTTFSPADEATAVAVGADIVLTFNEAIQRGAGSIVLKTAAGSTVATYDAATSSNLSISGNTLTINPTLDLASMTGYSMVLASGTVKDLAGNLYAGTSDYNFTTSASTAEKIYGAVTAQLAYSGDTPVVYEAWSQRSSMPLTRETLTWNEGRSITDKVTIRYSDYSLAGIHFDIASGAALELAGMTVDVQGWIAPWMGFSFTYEQTAQSVIITKAWAADYSSDLPTVAAVNEPGPYITQAMNSLPIGEVSLVGKNTPGTTLTLTENITDAEGISLKRYFWEGSKAVEGLSYTLSNTDVGQYVSAWVEYTDNEGQTQRVRSELMMVVATPSNAPPVLVTPAAITYTDTAGNDTFANKTGNLSATDADNDTLTYGVSGGTVANGISSMVGTYGTLSVNTSTGAYTFAPNDAAIEGIKTNTSETFTTTVGDGTSSANATLSLNLSGANDTPTGTVTISGTATQGQTLTAANTLADLDGLGTISYQWLADGLAIGGATGSTLTLGLAQVGKAISVRAGYTDNSGTAESLSSSPTDVIAVVSPPTFPTLTSKYFVLSGSGANFTDYLLNAGSLNLQGQAFSQAGTTGVDAIRVRAGTAVDFTLSGASADKVYLDGNYSDYAASLSGSVMTLVRGSGDTQEMVRVTRSTNLASSDVLVFANGSVSTWNLYSLLSAGTALPALGTETSTAPLAPAAAGSTLSASIKAFAIDSTGEVFAPSKPGVNFTAVGSVGVDSVYVGSGSTVDATLLGSSSDLVYFRGTWADYSKTVAGSVITFSRSIDGAQESVRVVGGNAALNDKLVFADGAVMSSNAKTALAINTGVAINTITTFDANTTTPGLNPTLLGSALDNVSNFDVSSNLVLNYSESVTAVSGKFIRIVNDGNGGTVTGFRGESSTHTLSIAANDTSQVSIIGGRVTLNPTFDLDLANNYHIEIDAGAFVGATSNLASAAYDGNASLNFQTVTPGTTALANAAASQKMAADGSMTVSYQWLDIEGIGSPSGSATALDLSGGNYSLVAKDYDTAGGNADSGYDGIQVGDLNVALIKFGLGDLIYIDDQGNNLNVLNDLTLTAVLDQGVAPTPIQFAGTSLGGFMQVSLLNSTVSFDSINVLNQLVGGTAVISA
ncbi:MAG: hypothetical protein CFE38_19555 [Comamonadaceae bacterium PBBC1]|nr:MAG: hypothetical protein CFE38_19555 [Comamonadaceae bacterium PBBC1]